MSKPDAPIIGSELYRRTMAYDYKDAARTEVMHMVWDGSPWMCDAYTGSTTDDRDHEIRQWCRDQFGPESWPLHGMPGKWQRGGATVYGWTWFGFETEEMMNQFIERWPEP